MLLGLLIIKYNFCHNSEQFLSEDWNAWRSKYKERLYIEYCTVYLFRRTHSTITWDEELHNQQYNTAMSRSSNGHPTKQQCVPLPYDIYEFLWLIIIKAQLRIKNCVSIYLLYLYTLKTLWICGYIAQLSRRLRKCRKCL